MRRALGKASRTRRLQQRRLTPVHARRPWPAIRESWADGLSPDSAEASTGTDASPEPVWVDVGPEGLEAFDPPRDRRVVVAGADAELPTLSDRPPADREEMVPWRLPRGGTPPARRHWMRHAALAAFICAAVAAGVDRLPEFRTPPGRDVANGPSVPLASAAFAAAVPFPAAARPTQPDEAPLPPAGIADAPPRVPVAGPSTLARVRAPAVPPSLSSLTPRVSPASRSIAGATDVDRVATTLAAVARPVGVPSPPPVVESAPAAPADRPVAAPAPPDAVADPRGRALEVQAIQRVLGHYRSAFNQLDAGAASSVWPAVNERALARAFDQLEGQVVSFDDCDIHVVDRVAEAACRGSARYVPKVGRRTPREAARRWTFSLRKTDDAWLIDRVDTR
ncbi:MAG: hypothetical protein R2745_08310 [Vicinamibacterales bacterium]